MVLRFCLIVVSINGFRGLAKTIGARSVTDNAATAGICRPGDDRPCRSGTLDPRAISRFRFSRLWPLKKLLCLQLLSCLCYTQKHAQLDARAHEAP
jgi:hypothetical protein